MGKFNHKVIVTGLPFGSAFTLSVPGGSGGKRGGGSGGGKRGGSAGGGKPGGNKDKKKKKQRCWRCKERGHPGKECKYSEEEAAAKKAEFSKKKEENASTSSSTTSAEAVKPPFPGWKPGCVVPPPPTHTNDVDM
ncbi:serine/arginine-rich splicing factor RSZ22-like [Folsomia candida]|nr:serine/arginine-rich splicing factor RSZ22-like [Folsomia candida]